MTVEAIDLDEPSAGPGLGTLARAPREPRHAHSSRNGG
jgi:hypothetical protein